MDEISVNMQVPPSPQWKTVYGHNGKLTYDLLWLQTHAINWHTFVDGDKVMLNYLSSYEMPLNGCTMDEAQLRERILRSFDEVLRPLYLEVEASIAEDLHVQIAEHVLQILKDGVEERPALTQEREHG